MNSLFGYKSLLPGSPALCGFFSMGALNFQEGTYFHDYNLLNVKG